MDGFDDDDPHERSSNESDEPSYDTGGDPAATLSEDEFPVPGTFAPCREWDSLNGYCFSTDRSILYTRTNNSKRLICGNAHFHEHDGKANIPGFEFAEGGAFAGILPYELMPLESTIKGSKWKIPRQARIRLSEFHSCAHCDIPEFNNYRNKDVSKLWAWLSQFAPELADAVHAEVRLAHGAEFKDWFALISVALRTRIIKRTEMSLLHIDHGIPKKIGEELWPLLEPDERRFLQATLLFQMCRKCNGSKSAKLLQREELTRMYGEVVYGSVAAARQDTIRWRLFENVLEKAYERRALG